MFGLSSVFSCLAFLLDWACVDVCANTGRHVNDVRLPRNALNYGFFYTRLFTRLERTASDRVSAGFPGEDDDWNGEASGVFGITL